MKKIRAILMLLLLVVGCGKDEQIQKQTSADQAAKPAAEPNVPTAENGEMSLAEESGSIDDGKTFAEPRDEASGKETPEGQLTTDPTTEQIDGLLPQQPKRWTLIMDTDKVESATGAVLSRIGGQEFAILVDGTDAEGLTYIQCDLDYGKYALEYQDGSTEQHYRATDSRLPLHRAMTAFKKYLNDVDSWKADFRWKRLPIE